MDHWSSSNLDQSRPLDHWSGPLGALVSFHPSLPLMAICYGSPPISRIERFQEEKPSLPPLHLKICDLKTLEMMNLDLPKDGPTEGPTQAMTR